MVLSSSQGPMFEFFWIVVTQRALMRQSKMWCTSLVTISEKIGEMPVNLNEK